MHFVDASSDPNGDVVAWEWDFGDGTTSTEQFPDHTYTDNGTYTVTLKVTDATGKSDTTTVDVTVKNVAPDGVGRGRHGRQRRPAAVLRSASPIPGARDAEALQS